MSTPLINPQKQKTPSNPNTPTHPEPKPPSLEERLQQLLGEADPGKLAFFLQKHPTFLLRRADHNLNRQLSQIYNHPNHQKLLKPDQIRLLQDIQYLCNLQGHLRNLPLPDLYHNPKKILEEINTLIPKKNRALRAAAQIHIIQHLVHRHLNEQCQWLKQKEPPIRQGIDRALNQLFYQAFQIENENPKFLETSIRYTIPALDQLSPYLQEVTNQAERAFLLSTQIGRPTPALGALSQQLASQAQLAPALSTDGITLTLEIYSAVYEHLLEKPVQLAIQNAIRTENRREAAELSHLPYHPMLHGNPNRTQ